MKKSLFSLALIFALAYFTPAAHAIDRNGFRRSTSIGTGQVSCGTTATIILTGSSPITGWSLNNNSGATIYIGPAGVTTSNGYALASGQSISEGGNHPFNGNLYCVVATGTSTITYIYKAW